MTWSFINIVLFAPTIITISELGVIGFPICAALFAPTFMWGFAEHKGWVENKDLDTVLPLALIEIVIGGTVWMNFH